MLDVGALLEREGELQTLLRLLRAAGLGSGHMVIVEGAAGIGKTRLLAAARAEAEQAGMRTLSARGSELERDFAYGIVRQLFEPVLVRIGEAERVELLAGTAGQAAGLFEHGVFEHSAAEAPTGGDPSFATLHALFWLTANLAGRAPLLLLVDDLHYADAPSLRFLAYLLPRLDGLAVLVVAAMRPAEPGTQQHLIAHIASDPEATLLHPAPLTGCASAQLVRSITGAEANEAFCAACHNATGGNPLLLRELATVAAAENVPATAEGVASLAEVGARAVARRVGLWLTRLGPAAAALASAAAILGEQAELGLAATLAGLEPGEALRVADDLATVEVLHPRRPPAGYGAGLTLGFVHPLVRAAVYEGLAEVDRIDGHALAARLLVESGAADEQIAAHLLLVPPAGDAAVVTTLRRAAEVAERQGSPDAALAYLERCLAELPPDVDLADLHLRAGVAAQLVDRYKAAHHLTAALAATEGVESRALIADMLGRVLFYAGRNDEAIQVYRDAVNALGDHDSDLRRRLECGLIDMALDDPVVRKDYAERIDQLRADPPAEGVGSKMLDCLIALHDALACRAAAGPVARVRRALSTGQLIEDLPPESAVPCGSFVLMAADAHDVMPLLDGYVADGHRRGSPISVETARTYRAMALLWRGSLADAEADARGAVRMIASDQTEIDRPFAGAALAEALMEQGRLADSATVLEWTGLPDRPPRTGHWYLTMYARARLLILRGRTEEGLDAMLAAGRRYAECHGGQNPAFCAWRSGAALALHALGRGDQARLMAAEELDLARQWGAPRALGRALRIAGLVTGREEGLTLLQEAVAMLAPSPARLEYGKALVDLGAALRRSGRPTESRDYLDQGVEQAEISGAAPLVERGRTELRAAGLRPRRVRLSGPQTLTPSERRVAELAADGGSNRDIAQALFVTCKTVEVHLTSAYRKLGIAGRAGLARTLAGSAPV